MTASPQEFINEWNGRQVDYDGIYAYQCVDLIKQYLAECYGLQPGAWGNAKDYWESPNRNVLTKFDTLERGTTTPQLGDIIVYGSGFGGGYGHIAIAVNATQMLEQNGGAGSASGRGTDAIRIRNIYGGYAGLLRPKGGTDMPSVVDTNVLRIVHSEEEGWPLKETHEGKYDKLFMDTFKGTETNAFVMQKWMQNGAWRARRQAALAFYDKYSNVIADLSSRPTKQELADALAKLSEEAERVKVAEAKAVDAATKASELQAQADADKAKGESALRVFGQWLAKFLPK